MSSAQILSVPKCYTHVHTHLHTTIDTRILCICSIQPCHTCSYVYMCTPTQDDHDKEAYYNADTSRLMQHHKYDNVQG